MTVLPAKLQSNLAPAKISAAAGWIAAVSAITLVGGILRAVGINRHSFWYDEAVTAKLIRAPWIDLLLGSQRDNGNPPLYWFAAKFWAAMFGDSEIALRSLSLALSVIAIPLLAMLARKLFDNGVSLLAAALLAISPLMIELGDEARAYAMLQVLAIASTLLFVRWVERERPMSLLVYCGVTLLACLCHYYAIFLPIAHGVSLIASHRTRRILVPWFEAMVLTALAGSFWLPAFWLQMHAPENLSRYGATWRTQFYATPLALAAGRTLVWRDSSRSILLLATAGAIVCFWLPAMIGLLRRDVRTVVLLLACAMLPLIIPLVAAILGTPLFHVRAASIALPAALLLCAAGLRSLPPRLAYFAGLGIISMTSVSIANYLTHPLKDDWRSAAPAIFAQADADTAVVFDSDIELTSFGYQARRAQRALPAMMIGVLRAPDLIHHTVAGARFLDDETPPHARDDCSDAIFSRDHIELVLCVPGGSLGAYETFFADHDYAMDSQSHFHRIDVYHFTRAHH